MVPMRATVGLQEPQGDTSAGDQLVAVRGGCPVAELRLFPAAQAGLRPFGLCAGSFTVPDDFDAPLSEEILRDFR